MRRTRKPTPAYSRVLSSFSAGFLLLASGLWRLTRAAPANRDERDAFIAIGLGIILLLAGLFWLRRLPRRWAATLTDAVRGVRRVGSGRSAGAWKEGHPAGPDRPRIGSGSPVTDRPRQLP